MPDNLENLGRKLDEIHERERALQAKSTGKEADAENMSRGVRAGAELVSAIAAGAFIGWLLDGWFETKPLFLIIMLLLGIATGFYNVWRVTQNIGINTGFSQLHTEKKDAKTSPDKK